MKKLLLFLLPVSVFFCGCQKVAQLLTFNISDSENIQVPATGPISSPVISPVPVSMNNQQTFQNNHTAANLVKNVTLQKLTLTMSSPANGNFDYLQSIKIYIGTSQSDTVLLAYANSIPTGVSFVDLTPSDAKLDPYIKAENYTLYTQMSIRSTVAQNETINSNSVFQVTADPL